MNIRRIFSRQRKAGMRILCVFCAGRDNAAVIRYAQWRIVMHPVTACPVEHPA